MQATREAIDHSKIKPEARLVIDWLARNVAQVYDFSLISKELRMPLGKVEAAIRELKHQRNGALIPSFGPFGQALRSRHAWLPKESPLRADYPPLEHPPLEPPPAPVKAERPSAARARTITARDQLARAKRADRKLARQTTRLVKQADLAATREERVATREEMKRRAVANFSQSEEKKPAPSTNKKTTTQEKK